LRTFYFLRSSGQKKGKNERGREREENDRDVDR